MDFSQLPRMSETARPQDPTSEPAARPMAEPLGLEFAIIGAGIGTLLLLFFVPPTNIYHLLFNQALLPTTTDKGVTIPYVQSAFFKTDLGFTVFAVTLVLEGLLLGFTRGVWVRYLAAGLAGLVVVLNVWALVVTKSLIGLQLANALAVIIAMVMCITAVRSVRPQRLA